MSCTIWPSKLYYTYTHKTGLDWVWQELKKQQPKIKQWKFEQCKQWFVCLLLLCCVWLVLILADKLLLCLTLTTAELKVKRHITTSYVHKWKKRQAQKQFLNFLWKAEEKSAKILLSTEQLLPFSVHCYFARVLLTIWITICPCNADVHMNKEQCFPLCHCYCFYYLLIWPNSVLRIKFNQSLV